METLAAGGGIMVTASHNPGEYNGFKICREGVRPIGSNSGLKDIEAAVNADVLSKEHLSAVKDELSAIKPMESVFFPEFVRRLRGENVKASQDKMELAEAVREDIRRFKKDNDLDRCVAVWCGSTVRTSRRVRL